MKKAYKIMVDNKDELARILTLENVSLNSLQVFLYNQRYSAYP